MPIRPVAVQQPLIAAGAIILAACQGPPSALMTAGRDAERIASLFAVMATGALIVWAAIIVIAIYAIRRDRETDDDRTASPGSPTQLPPVAAAGGTGTLAPRAAAARGTPTREPYWAGDLLIIGGGVVVPTVVLGALLAYSLPLLPEILTPAPPGSLQIEVSAKQWWWRVRYRTEEGVIETANELRLPVGQRVGLRLESGDVIHSFWVPSIAGKIDMIPGRVTRLALEPTRTGEFRGVCAEYCGASHALMRFVVVVVDSDEFRGWLERQAQPAETPRGSLATRGQAELVANGCGACHTVRGTAADGTIGPDLTHVGARLRIGGGVLASEPEAFRRWIAQTDRVKPGVHMPAFRALPPDVLLALAAYLDSLQ